jgi:DNA-binding NarL/FixJ family response regulator
VSTVLIVDDHPSFRVQARAVLEAGGHVVVGEASDGRSGIELARALLPEVVLLDVGLPDLDGFEVAHRLSAAQSPALVILTSSRDGAEYGPRVTESSAVGFIAKDELSGRAIVELVAQARAATGAAR